MGMFGTYATPQGMPAGPYDPAMQVKQAGPRRLGMLGQITQALTGPTGGRNLQIAGATLRQLGGGANSNTLSELLAQLQQQDQQRLQQTWQQTLQQRQRGEWKRSDQQDAAADQFISSLPPDQQTMARVLGPEAYLQRMMPTAWQHFYGRAGRINPDGSVDLAGRIPEAPHAAAVNVYNGTPFTPNPAGVAPPQLGEVQDGYRYNGGDPADPSSWEPAQ